MRVGASEYLGGHFAPGDPASNAVVTTARCSAHGVRGGTRVPSAEQ